MGSELRLCHFDNEVSERLTRVELDLVGDLRGNGRHVAGGKLLFRAALDGGGAHFVRRRGLAVHQLAAGDERGLAAQDEEDIGLRSVIFGFARASAVSHHETVVTEVGDGLCGDLFSIHFGRQGFAEAFQLRGLPQEKAGGIARGHGKTGEKQGKGKWFHAVTVAQRGRCVAVRRNLSVDRPGGLSYYRTVSGNGALLEPSTTTARFTRPLNPGARLKRSEERSVGNE